MPNGELTYSILSWHQVSHEFSRKPRILEETKAMDDLYQDVTGYNRFDTIEIDVKVHNATDHKPQKGVDIKNGI